MTKPWGARPLWIAAILAAVLLPFACGVGCDGERNTPPPATTSVGVGGTDGGGAGSPVDGGDAGSLPCDAAAPSPGEWDPDASCWAPVRWPSPCIVEMALQPELGAPPLTWVPCGDDAPGCEQQFEQPLLDTNSQASKASVVPWNGGYRIGIREASKTEGRYAFVYDTDGTPMIAWRVRSLAPYICEAVRPIVTPERVWFGVSSIDTEGLVIKSVYIAPGWNELATIETTIIEVPYLFQSWYASSEIAVGWIHDGLTLHIEDLTTGKRALFGGGQQGNPDYAYPQVIGSTAVALTAPDGYPDLTVWDRSTEAFVDLVDPPPPALVSDGRSDGQTLVWIVAPDKESPGQLWTSPMTVTAQGLQATMRRSTPPVLTQSSVAHDGYYAVYSFSDVLLPEGGPGDGDVHVYRLSDARHWSFPVPKTSIDAVWIYHVDEDYVFYSGYGPILRQRLDGLGPGDPPP